MPLNFLPPADPLTPAIDPTYVIESDALQRLTKEIARYSKRELAGRSILIAGHRGVGKTTLVRKAIENVRKSAASYDSRPLFVDIHGPDLLAPPEKKAESKPAQSVKKQEGPESKPAGDEDSQDPGIAQDSAEPAAPGKDASVSEPSGADLQSFVERLTFSLYRAAVKEFVESFRDLRSRPAPGPPLDPALFQLRYDEYSELAEQFALELDGSTDLGRIRLLYERAGAFQEGVLNRSRQTTGAQELALLAASSQAYRIISGKLDEDQSGETSGQNTLEWSLAADNLLAPIAGLVTGGLVWAALPEGFGPLSKLLASFTTGLASTVALKFSRAIQRTSKQSAKISFVPERNRLALRRLLPVLVDRFSEIGIPPIFVVDELDKVPNISERMESLMGFLKQFVTERAFFCFLVDRDYFEKLEGTVSTKAFPKEATLFGDRLFVQYAPEAAHTYLTNVIKVGTLAVGESTDDADRDMEVLRYVLLRRSYMHPFDLRREISRSTNARNEFRFPPRTLFNAQQYRNEVYYQVAVECVLAGELFLDFVEDPSRAQLMYDTLYYPIRTKNTLVEFDASEAALQTHLDGRMGEGNGKLVADDDRVVLYGALNDLLKFLCDPLSLLRTIQSLADTRHLPAPKVFPRAAVSVIEAAAGPQEPAVPVPPNSPAPKVAAAPAAVGPNQDPAASVPAPQVSLSPTPLLAKVNGEKYRWLFDKFGYPIVTQHTEEVKQAVAAASMGAQSTQVSSKLAEFEDAAKLLSEKSGTAIDIELWESMRLIPTPPTWSYVRDAVAALGNPASLPPTRVEEYQKALTLYHSNFQAAVTIIGSALAIAATMSASERKRVSAQQDRRWIEALGEVLAQASSRDPMLLQLQQIMKEVVAPPTVALGPTPSYRDMLTALERTASAARGRQPQDAGTVAQRSGTFYENWFMQFYEGRPPSIDSIWPLLSLATASLPFGLRKVNPLRMTIHDWNSNLRAPNPRQFIVSLERLGRRGEAASAASAAAANGDPVIEAVIRSIRKRGNERATALLMPLPTTLTQEWMPSESIGCKIGTPFASENYILVEVANSSDVENGVKSFGQYRSPTTQLALFGSAPSLPGTAIPNGIPYITNPQSLDDLVGRARWG